MPSSRSSNSSKSDSLEMAGTGAVGVPLGGLAMSVAMVLASSTGTETTRVGGATLDGQWALLSGTGGLLVCDKLTSALISNEQNHPKVGISFRFFSPRFSRTFLSLFEGGERGGREGKIDEQHLPPGPEGQKVRITLPLS